MILSAQFANAERTSVTAITDDRGAVSMPIDAPEYKAFGGATAPFVPQDLSVLDQDALNAMLVADGSIMRGVVAVLRSEVNILRNEINVLRAAITPPLTPPLPQRTVPIVVAAIKATMRT